MFIGSFGGSRRRSHWREPMNVTRYSANNEKLLYQARIPAFGSPNFWGFAVDKNDVE